MSIGDLHALLLPRRPGKFGSERYRQRRVGQCLRHIDNDNDAILDGNDAFPLDRAESIDADGNTLTILVGKQEFKICLTDIGTPERRQPFGTYAWMYRKYSNDADLLQ